MLGLSETAYYSALRRKSKQIDALPLKHEILRLRKVHPRLGIRKCLALLKSEAPDVFALYGRDKVFDFARREGLLIKRNKRYIKTTDSHLWQRQHKNHVKNLVLERPEQLFVADITYIGTTESPYYLHLVTDAFSKRIMGFEASDNMHTKTSIEALKMAISSREYEGDLTHHSDRGKQYLSAAYQEVLNKAKIRCSTTQDGSPYDNAVAERVNGILKQEYHLEAQYRDLDHVKKVVAEAIVCYNKHRPHISLGYRRPEEFHKNPEAFIKTYKSTKFEGQSKEETGNAEEQPASNSSADRPM